MANESARLTHLKKEVKFGRIPATEEMVRRALPLGAYVKRYGAQPPPARADWYSKANRSLREMLGNDQYGDCVVAAAAHGVGAWSAHEPGGKEAIATTDEVVKQYFAVCGPGDNGCYIPRVLDHFRDTGFTFAGKQRKIEGYVRVNPRDELLVKTATHLFGGLHLGVNWPRDWMGDAKPGGILQPTNSPIIGGHAVQVVGYDDKGLVISTWGIVCHLSWAALASPRFVDECYAMLGDDWFDEKGATAAGAGVSVEKLREDLRIIQGGGTPDVPGEDDPTPTPPTPTPPGALWEWEKSFDVMGFTIRLVAGLYRDRGHALKGATWFDVVPLVWEVVKAVRAGDWARVAQLAADLVRILGDLLNSAERPRLAAFLEGARKALAPTGEGEGEGNSTGQASESPVTS